MLKFVSFCFLFTYAHTNQFILTPLHSSGFHYEFQSNLGFVVNTWSFILNIDHNFLKSKVQELQNVTQVLKLENCSHNIEYEEQINYLNKKIQHLLDVHDNINLLLLHKRLTKKKRTKRGLFGGAFNFMGRFYKYTMGVMDDEDAAVLYEVASHTNNTDYRVKVLTNQTLQMSKWLHELQVKVGCSYFEKQFLYIKDALNEIKDSYDQIFTSIQTSLYSNTLSTAILSPRLLLSELTDVDTNAWDSETQWVVRPNFENIHTIMRLVTCNVFINPQNQLMFVIQVPRMDKSKFTLYKPVALPLCDQNKMCKFIAPQSQYIGFEDRGESKHYVRLDDTSTCTIIDNITLCYGSMTSKKIEYSSSCDVRLFKNLNNNNCEVHATTFHSEIFHSLNNVNRWLFIINEKPIHADLNCGSGVYNKRITLHGMGVLTVLQYCKLKTSRSTLISKHLSTTDNTLKVVDFNMTNYVIPHNFSGGKIVKNLDYDSLKEVTQTLKKLMTQEEADSLITLAEDDTSYANWYYNLFGNWWWELKFIIYSLCIIVIAMLIIKIKSACCYHNNDKYNQVFLNALSPK